MARMGEQSARARIALPVAAVGGSGGRLSATATTLSPGGRQRVVAEPLEAPIRTATPMRRRVAAILIAGAFLAVLAAAGVAAVMHLHPKPAPSYKFPLFRPEHTTYRMPSLS